MFTTIDKALVALIMGVLFIVQTQDLTLQAFDRPCRRSGLYACRKGALGLAALP